MSSLSKGNFTVNFLFLHLKLFLASCGFFLKLGPMDSHPTGHYGIYVELVQIGEARVITNTYASLFRFVFVLLLVLVPSTSAISPFHDSFPPCYLLIFFQTTFSILIKPTNINSTNSYLPCAPELTWGLTPLKIKARVVRCCIQHPALVLMGKKISVNSGPARSTWVPGQRTLAWHSHLCHKRESLGGGKVLDKI